MRSKIRFLTLFNHDVRFSICFGLSLAHSSMARWKELSALLLKTFLMFWGHIVANKHLFAHNFFCLWFHDGFLRGVSRSKKFLLKLLLGFWLLDSFWCNFFARTFLRIWLLGGRLGRSSFWNLFLSWGSSFSRYLFICFP